MPRTHRGGKHDTSAMLRHQAFRAVCASPRSAPRGVEIRRAGSTSMQANSENEETTMPSIKNLVPCLWFDTEAEEAARFYTGIFDNSRITDISRYGKEGHEIHGREPGSVMVVVFELDGHPFTALNGGPLFRFNESVSFQVMCETQQEVDWFWDRLREGGDPKAQQCGWLKDRFGLSWQVIPARAIELIRDPGSAKAQRATKALLKMKKLDLAALERAYDG
jgi:predicted 3-demethylubiquinone-9 3-methyltransferase (glyoxalase superfamily)